MEHMEKNEIWKDIKGYEELYQVSSLGRVRSKDKLINSRGNKKRLHRGIILRPKKKKSGYLEVSLYKDKKHKSIQVHRLVAETFIPNPQNKPEVNHKKVVTNDFCDNSIYNLEWCTREENMQHSFKYGNRIVAKSRNSTSSKAVQQYTTDGKLMKKWFCTMDIQRELGIPNSHISACCLGKRKTAGGYKWKYIEKV